jgi:hypothetical protein
MLLDRYESEQQLYNVNFKEAATRGGLYAYRGDLVIIDGEIADAQGRRKPPVAGMLGGVLLTDADKIKLMAGSIDDMALIKPLLEKYQADFAPDMKALIYVVNIAKPMITELCGVKTVLISMTDGMVWNELVDELALEKSDFKGQSSADKVITVLGAFNDYKPKYETVSLDEAMTRTTDAKRESRGPV